MLHGLYIQEIDLQVYVVNAADSRKSVFRKTLPFVVVRTSPQRSSSTVHIAGAQSFIVVIGGYGTHVFSPSYVVANRLMVDEQPRLSVRFDAPH